MSAPNAMDAKWHDLAQRFDAGETSIVSPPMRFEEAKAMRWGFYRWRAELREAEKLSRTPLYKKVHEVVVSPTMNEEDGKWTVTFQLLTESATYRALEERLARPPRAEAHDD